MSKIDYLYDAVDKQPVDFKNNLSILSSIFSISEESFEIINNDLTNLIKIQYKGCSQYIINKICFAIEVRPKNRVLLIKLLKTILEKFPYYYLIDDICTPSWNENDAIYKGSYIVQSILVRSGLITKNDIEYDKVLSLNKCINPYKKNSLEMQIMNDDLESFQNSVNSYVSFDFNMNLILDSFNPMLSLSGSHYNFNLSYFATFYGSIKIFKYLILNDATIDEEICKPAVAGGNTEIIHILEQKNYKFLFCLDIAIKYHRNDIADWLLLHFQPMPPTLNICNYCMNDAAVIYLIEKGMDINVQIYETTLIHFTCEKGNYFLTKYLIEKGADPNCKISYFNHFPLHYAVKFENTQLINYLLDKGAAIVIKDQIPFF